MIPDLSDRKAPFAQTLADVSDQAAKPPLPAEMVADRGLPRLAIPLASDAPPLETTGAPAAATSGGGSRYDSDFGQVIEGLQANAADEVFHGTATPGSGLAVTGLAPADSIVPSSFAQVAPSGNDTGTGDDDTGSGDGDDTGTGGDEFSALFTVHPNTVDFNSVKAGSYLDGTQHDADNQDDFVLLPSDADAAAEAGFVDGTLFLTGNGNDTVIGGTLADLIDGGNGQDLLDGGAGDDTLIGGNAADTLIGGLGDDVMTGGQGKDVFAYSLSANEGDDRIVDFTSGKGGDVLQISGLLDVNGDGKRDIADLDAGGHRVSGTADAVVITFDSGTSITLAGIDGTGIDSFADLVSGAKVNIHIL